MVQTAGAIGGITASFVRVPTEVRNYYNLYPICVYCTQTGSYCIQVVKQRMQTGQFKKAPDAVRLIVAKEGFKGLYAVCICCTLINYPLLNERNRNNFLKCNTYFYFKSG